MSELQSIARQHFTERRTRGKRFMDDHERCKVILNDVKIDIAKAFGIYEHSFEIKDYSLDENIILTSTRAEEYGNIRLCLKENVLISIHLKYNGKLIVDGAMLDIKSLSAYIRAVVLRSDEFLDKMFNINGGRLPSL